jgi:hypothetical protein
MTKISKILIIILILAFGAVGVFLASWEMPPPLAKVEKVLPNDRVLR